MNRKNKISRFNYETKLSSLGEIIEIHFVLVDVWSVSHGRFQPFAGLQERVIAVYEENKLST